MQENSQREFSGVNTTLEALRTASIVQLDSLIITSHKKKSTYSFSELYKLKDEVQKFILPELIPAQVVSVLIGEDGIGKTQIMTQLCLSIAFGFDTFFGLPLYAPNKRALICATEESRFKFTEAIMKQAFYMNSKLNPDEVQIDFTEGSDFDDFLKFKEELETQLSAKKYDVCIIDALSDLFMLIDGDINNNSHARKLISFFQHLCNEYETTCIIIHHAAKTKITAKHKEGKIFVEKNDSQGAGAITQKARTVLALSNDPKSTNEDGTSYTNYFHVLKTNVMTKKYVKTAFELRFNTDYLLHSPVRMQDIQVMETGEPIPAASLVEPEANNKRKVTANEISRELHFDTLNRIYSQSDILKRDELVALMIAHYGVGKVKIEQKDGYLSFIQENGYVTKTTAGFKYNRPTKNSIVKQTNLTGEFDEGFDEAAPF